MRDLRYTASTCYILLCKLPIFEQRRKISISKINVKHGANSLEYVTGSKEVFS